MKKSVVILFMLTMMSCFICLGSCGVIEEKDDKKIGDVEFDIISEENLPKEVKELVEKGKNQSFKTTYTDGGNLYIIAGYGKQQTGGYSIAVEELHETNNSIYVKLKFMGPSKNEEVTQEFSYPYIVIRMQNTGKSVVFK